MQEIIFPAIEQLCSAFERNGYCPTPIIDLGVLIANADGQVDDREREVLLEIFQALLDTKLTREVVDHLVTASAEVIQAAGSEPRARLVAAILRDCDAAESGLRVALAIAFASEGLSSSERAVIDRIAAAAGVSKTRVEDLVREVKKYTDADGPVSARRSLVSSPRVP